jgi:hypothetical protein
MIAHARTLLLVAAVGLLCHGFCEAQQPGTAYRWRAPGAYFGEPTPISDRDEASTSQSSFSIGYRAEPVTETRSRDILIGKYRVVPNPALGYAYAGFAIPFNTPMALNSQAAFQFDARTDSSIDRLEVVLRDTSRRRATHVVTLEPSKEWTTVSVPAAQLASVDQDAIESAAVVVLAPGEGTIEVSNVQLPVRALVKDVSVIEEIRTAPKWYTDAEMGVRVAQRLDRPILIRLNNSSEGAMTRLDSDQWRGVTEQTVNIVLSSEDLSSLPEGFELMSFRSQDPLIYLFGPGGELIIDAAASDSGAKSMADALAKRAGSRSQ